jgi:hypothetical protein
MPKGCVWPVICCRPCGAPAQHGRLCTDHLKRLQEMVGTQDCAWPGCTHRARDRSGAEPSSSATPSMPHLKECSRMNSYGSGARRRLGANPSGGGRSGPAPLRSTGLPSAWKRPYPSILLGGLGPFLVQRPEDLRPELGAALDPGPVPSRGALGGSPRGHGRPRPGSIRDRTSGRLVAGAAPGRRDPDRSGRRELRAGNGDSSWAPGRLEPCPNSLTKTTQCNSI